MLNNAIALTFRLLQRDDEGESVPKDPSGMDILHRNWEKAYDEQKKQEELDANARGEQFEGVAGDRTDKDSKDYQPDPFYEEFNDNNDTVPANDTVQDTVPDKQCGEQTVADDGAADDDAAEEDAADDSAADEGAADDGAAEEAN